MDQVASYPVASYLVDMGPAQDQVAMDREEQELVLVFILLVVQDWARINHPNQVRVKQEK